MSTGWDDMGLDLGLAAASVVPGLRNSSNPDVARGARAATEVGAAILRRFILIQILSILALLAVVPYWFGAATVLLAVGATGWFMLLGVLGLGFVVPLMALLAHKTERLVLFLVIFAGAGIGIWALASGYFATIPA